MPWQNVFAAFFQAGNTIVINSGGEYIYNGTPAAGNLLASVTPTAGEDEEGNPTVPVIAVYSGFTNGSLALALNGNSVVFYEMIGGVWANVSAIFWQVSSDAVIVNSSLVVEGMSGNTEFFGPVNLANLATPTPKTGASAIYSNVNGTVSAVTNGEVAGAIPIESTDGGGASGNVTTPTLITATYDLDNILVPDSTYTLKCWFNGTWGAQIMTIYADISGTSTALATIGAVFATGTASGDAVNGWIEVVVYVASTSTCRIAVSGAIHDQTVNANNSTAATAAISGTVMTGVAIAGTDTLGIAVKFAASAAGQTIQSEFAKFTRGGE
jgi:hypothetical protein